MTDPRERPDVATLSYEQARDELIQVVTSLEHGTASLEDSLALWERGEALADHCQGWLDSAKQRLAAASADRAEAHAGGGSRDSDDAAGGDHDGGDHDGGSASGADASDNDGPPW